MSRGTLSDDLAFLTELDRLKGVRRASPVLGGARRENSAEHSWHVAMCALVLAPHAPAGVSVDRAVRMLLVHDIVEIDAGDVPIHAEADRAAQAARERAAADRLFGPRAGGSELRALWDAFEAGESADARFARAVDRLQPVLLNLAAGGGSWTDYAVTLAQMDARVAPAIERGLPGLWPEIRARIAPWFEARGRGDGGAGAGG